MGQRHVHRGPDDEGTHADGRWRSACGGCRSSTSPAATSRSPTRTARCGWSPTARSTTTASCGASSSAQGHRFRTGSDCETILHLYEEHGDDFVQHLNGMFALRAVGCAPPAPARRPRPARHQAALPVQRRQAPGRSPARPRRCSRCPGSEPELDPAALRSYLALGYVPAPQSIFRGIRKLPPATLLIAEDGRVEERRYWRVPRDVDRTLSEDEWVDARARAARGIGADADGERRADRRLPVRRHRFQRGRRLHGGAQRPAGQDLRDRLRGRRRPRPIYNELPYARQVAQHFGTDHHEILVRPDVVSLLPRLLWHMDEPIADTAFITTYLVSEFARRDVTVILSGVGGDELFGGYRRYLGSHYQAYFERLPAWRAARGARAGREAAERPPFAAAQRDAPGQGLSRDRRTCRSRSAIGPTCRSFPPTSRRELLRERPRRRRPMRSPPRSARRRAPTS